MKNIYKILVIALIFVVSVFLLLLLVRPAFLRSSNHLIRITEEEERNSSLNSELDHYLEDRGTYYVLNAEYQKLAMELPDNDDTLILTNELYEIARYTEIGIMSLAFTESGINEDELMDVPLREINIELVLEGSYYQILNFINTIEIMPRIIKVENIIIQASETDFDKLLTFVTAKTYFKNPYYK